MADTRNSKVADADKSAKASKAGKAGKAAKVKVKKKVKKEIRDGIAHVYATFNNTIVTISDVQGNVIAWATSALCGYRGSRKSTPFAAGEAAVKAATIAAATYNMKSVQVKVRGPGSGRESAIRSLRTVLDVSSITDVTPIPHNGCQSAKKRRV